jgi:ABC-type branched-subunit amino acid transport system substrate-binding protein
MLRGVAQAQDEAVKCDPDKQYPNSVPKVNLQVLLADDLNDPDQAGSLAQVLMADRRTFDPLAVVGHYISDATCKALEQGYREAGVPVIAPLSTLTDLRKDCGGDKGPNYVFRNTSSTAVEARTIVDDIKEKFPSSRPKVAIFYNPDDSFSRDLFIEVRDLIGDQAVNITAERQLKDINNPSDSLQESGIENSNIMIVLPDGKNKDSTSFNNAVELIKANRGERLVYGSNPLYNNEDVVQPLLNSIGLKNLEDRFFIPTDWHKGCGSKDFVNRSQQYWGGTVNRVTALAYEAVYVLLAGLRGEVTRDTLGTYLTDLGTQTTDNFVKSPIVKSPIFDDKTVSFDPVTGDRNEIQERVLTTIGDNPQDPFVVVDNRCP